MQPLREAAVELRHQAVEVRRGAVVAREDDVPVRIRPPRVGRRKSDGVGRNLVEVGADREFDRVLAVVGQPQRRVPAQFLLEGQAPLLVVRVGVILLVGRAEILRADHRNAALRARERQRELEGRNAIGVEAVDERAHVRRVNAGQRIEDCAEDRDRVDAVTASDHGLRIVERAEGEAQARREVVVIGRAQHFGHASLFGRHHLRRAD